MLSVEKSLKSCHLPDGYRIEAILTEPPISEPVACAFDGHGHGNGQEIPLAPSFVTSHRKNGHHELGIKVLLHGLTGSLDEGKTYSAAMVGMASCADEWIADALSYIRQRHG